MRQLQFSSGDIVVDRRAGYAVALAAEHAHAEAAELMAQALELAPGWAAGWSLLGEYREAAGDVAGAIAAWRTLESLDVAGAFGARLKLAAHGVGDAAADPGYVEALFDDYAPRFEASLVDRLDYRTPEELGELVRAAGVSGGTALDLGCGTGLMGVELRPLAERLEGVDLSAAMLREAAKKGIYDRLVRGELTGFLGAASGAGAIAAADVLNYVGALPPVLEAAWQALAPGGIFALSLETHEGPEAVKLRTTLRYAHRPEAAMEAARTAGFAIETVKTSVLRMERGAPVDGVLAVLRK